jgi:hypothetical protein
MEEGMAKISGELFREEGKESRFVDLRVNADGSMGLYTQDIGPTAKAFWGDDDYEFGVGVPAAALPKLVFALVREKYLGRANAVDEFREFCKKKVLNTKIGLADDEHPIRCPLPTRRSWMASRPLSRTLASVRRSVDP